MARRRKSNANGKTKSKDRSVSTESDTQHEDNEEKNLIGSNKVLDSASEPTQSDNSESINDIDNSQERMMPLDIQQMILGDLQSAGRGEEIIVSRESGADIMEDGAEEVVAELGAVVESPREEEYDIHSEGEEEEELVFMNEEDGEEGQYVIVVNSEFDVTDDTSQEVMSIQNLSELQEGSCEIITVVRESDYDSSQESLDGMEEEECDNINAVIGTIDGIHCVKISQYHSDDESSNHDSSFEKEEIRVTEHETEIECFTAFDNGSDQNMVGCLMTNEDDNIESCELSSDAKDDILNTDGNHEMFDCRETPSSEMVREDENSQVRTNKKLPQGQTGAEIVNPTMKNDHSKGLDSFENDDEIKHSLNLKNEKTDLNVVEMLPFFEVNMKPTANDSDSDLKQPINQNKSIDVKSTRNNLADSSECEASVKKSEKSTIVSENSYSSTLDSHFTCAGIEPLATTVKSESHSGSLQEHKITSNSSVSESVPRVGTPKMETLSNSPLDYVCVQASNVKIEDKTDSLTKEETLKFEEDKQSAFRSRSGSTDTTGSESGSNSSSGRRRSGRIRSIGASKLSEIDIKQGGGATAVVTSTTTPPVPGYELDKPVKVKSRWRRSSELEMGSSNKRQQELDVITANARLIESDTSNTSTPPSRAGRPSTPPDTPPSDKEVEEILLNFQHLDCNEYLTDRSRSKDAKRMVCDCMLTKEEIARGDMGCGEDCLNRLLMIECGARCMLGERCANKRFQNLEYSKCEVFKTEMKGFGLRALDDIPTDTFLLEYVGEVLDPKEFRRRAKEYAKDKNLHFYFMALKSDSIIDATQKGNISRFINHSCDPNAETQKWTVNGELRVGFFSKRPISAGEEITFDYKFQRYGKEAQRCYCQTASCRGWIGEDPEKENKWSDVSGRNKERREKERKKKEDKRNVKDILNDIDLEEEIEKLVLKNRAQTLMLCRLMVRAEDHSSRVQLLRILQKGETACLRLFLDYHGLRLVWSWMMDPASSSSLKIEILETLSKLPIPNKTMLQDSKVLSVVEKWSTAALPVTEAKDRSSTEDDSDKTESDKDKQVKGSDTEKNSDDSNSSKPVETEEQHETNKQKIIEVSNILLKDWASLKEVFRIPKKERIEQMKEHEREADKVSRDSSVEKQDKSYDRHRSQDKYRNDFDRRDRDRDKERDRDRDKDRKRGRDSPDSDRSRKSSRMDDRQAQITKMERRQLFAIKAAQEDEERQRRQQEQVWQEQVHLAAQELAAQQAQQEANNFAGFPGFPPPQQWMPFPPDPNMMPPPQHMEAQQMFGGMNPNNQPPPFLFNQPGPHMHQHPPFLDPSHNPPFHNPVNPIFNHPPPLPKQPLLPTPNQPSLLTPPLPNQPLIQTPNQPLLPTPPLPNQPYLPQQQNEPLLPIQPMSNKPLPINVPSFTTQPPLPSQPPPIVITNQPTPVPTLSFSQDVIPPQLFQSALPPQNQFSQPPPFVSQPPLPSVPPTQNHQPVFQSPIPAQFQPPLPQTSVVPVTSTVSSVPLYVPTPVRLPPKWKSAKDAEGRTYYYHVKTRVSQWEPPLWEQHQQTVQESDTDSESSESDEDESSSEEEEQEEEKMVEEEETQPTEEVNHDDYLGCEELGDSPYEPETMELLEDIVEDTKKKRKDVLVQERIISPRTADEIPDKLDKRKIRELKERLRRQKAKEKLRLKQKSKSKGRSGTSKCEADTSSDPGRKIKDAFRLNMAGVIVHYLNVYRKPDCKFGKITNTEDFKHLARKLTHFVMLKELKHCRSVDELECNDNVKHKARDFIKKYMSKFGAVYQRPSDDD